MTAFARGRGYRMALDAQPVRGPAGERFGRGTGSSLEFQEFRDYQAGDDLRHVDWRAYARTETLTTRLYREEIAATVELLLDGSVSLALTDAKRRAAVALFCFLAGAASGDSSVRALLAEDPPAFVPLDELRVDRVPEFTGRRALNELPLSGLLRPGTVRVVISDFLFPLDARALVRQLAARAHRLVMLQLLDAEEWEPDARGSLRLVEAESGRTRELPVDDAAAARYRERLARHSAALDEECRRAGGLFVRLSAATPLDAIARDTLLPAGIVAPR